MAARKGSFGKSVALLFLIFLIIVGGTFWLHYLGIIHSNTLLKGLSAFGYESTTTYSESSSNPVEDDLDEIRFQKKEESFEIQRQEIAADRLALDNEKKEVEALIQQLNEEKKSLEEQKATIDNEVRKINDRNANITKITSYLASMPPKTAVAELLSMDDQDIIDILRKEDEMAVAAKSATLSSVWLMNMPAERAAQIERKMANKPETLD